MKTVQWLVELPVEAIAEALGPEIVKEIREADRQRVSPTSREPLDALLHAVELVAKAVDQFDNSQTSRAERQAADKVITAAKGLRKAYRVIKLKRNQS